MDGGDACIQRRRRMTCIMHPTRHEMMFIR